MEEPPLLSVVVGVFVCLNNWFTHSGHERVKKLKCNKDNKSKFNLRSVKIMECTYYETYALC